MVRFFISLFLLTWLPIRAQPKPANCIHSSGLLRYSDAILGSLGACNCQKAPVFLSNSPKCDEGSYKIIFEDEFNGDSLDLQKWMACPWTGGALDGAQNVGASSLRNITVKDGICFATAKKETVFARVDPYSDSVTILIDGKRNYRQFDYSYPLAFSRAKFLYGKYEIRCRLPVGNGYWPAFWTYGGQRGNEIDFFDGYNGVTGLITSIGHDFDNNQHNHGCNDAKKGFDFSTWTTFTGIFDHNKIEFYVNGRLERTINRLITIDGKILQCGEDVEAGTYFQLKAYPAEPMYLIFGMGLLSEHGPAGSIAIDEKTPFPATMEIDYIRVSSLEPEHIRVIPTVADDWLYIDGAIQAIESVDITDSMGRRIFFGRKENSQSNTRINTSSFPDGIYYVLIRYPDQVVTQKIIIVH